jgi:hypothetical protein
MWDKDCKETQTGVNDMLASSIITIPAAGANIIKTYPEFDLVAVQHPNGYVGIYSEEDGELFMIGNLRKSDTIPAVDLADRMVNA